VGRYSADKLSLINQRSEIRNRAGRALFFVLPLLFFVLFFYLPVGSLIGRGITENGDWTFARIAELLSNAHIRSVIFFTFKQALLSALLSLVIGFGLAYFLSNTKFPGRNLLRSLTIVPFALPPVAVAIGFLAVYGESGAISTFFTEILGFSDVPLRIRFSLFGIILAHAFYNAPIVARFVASAWDRIPSRYEEGARSMGASRLRTFWDVTLPMLLPSMLSGGMLAFIFSFLSFPVVALLGGAQFATIEFEIYTLYLQTFDAASGITLSSIAILLSLVFMLIYLFIDRSVTNPIEASFSRSVRELKARWIYFPVLGVLLLFFLAPVIGIFVDSFTRTTADGTFFTLEWYSVVFNPVYSAGLATPPLYSILNSLKYAVLVSFFSLAIGTLLSLALTKRRGLATELTFMIPLAFSPVAFGLALLLSSRSSMFGLAQSGIAVVVAHSILAIPFVIRAVRPALSQLSGRVAESAQALGAPAGVVLWEITLPLIKGSLVVGAVFAFAISIAEMSAAIMILGQNEATMPMSMFLLQSRFTTSAPSAMSVIMIVILAGAFILMDRFGRLRFE